MTQSCRNTSPYELVPMTNIDFFAKCGGSILDQVLLSYSSFCTAWNSMWWRHVGGKISQGRISIGSKTTGSLFLCFSKKTSKNKIELNIFFYNFVDGFVLTFSFLCQFNFFQTNRGFSFFVGYLFNQNILVGKKSSTRHFPDLRRRRQRSDRASLRNVFNLFCHVTV